MGSGRPAAVHGRDVFRALARSPRRARAGPVTVHFLPEAHEDPGPTGALEHGGTSAVRVAYAVGRTTGGAVVRNRCRRRLRAIAAEIAPELPPGAYLVNVGPEAAGMHFEELRERVSQTMRSASGAGR